MKNNNWKYRIRQWLSGRNGMDQMARDLYFLSLIIVLLQRLTRLRFLSSLGLLIMCYSLFRVFSKRSWKREEENQKYMTFRWKIISRIKSWKKRTGKDSQYRYFKCPKCHQQLRVPKGKGKLEITCPKCGHHFNRKS